MSKLSYDIFQDIGTRVTPAVGKKKKKNEHLEYLPVLIGLQQQTRCHFNELKKSTY